MEALTYELLIRQAHDCERAEIDAADADLWTAFIESEHQANATTATADEIHQYQDSLQEMRDYIYAALREAAKRMYEKDGASEGITALVALADRASNAKNSAQIGGIIEDGMALLQVHGIGFEE